MGRFRYFDFDDENPGLFTLSQPTEDVEGVEGKLLARAIRRVAAAGLILGGSVCHEEGPWDERVFTVIRGPVQFEVTAPDGKGFDIDQRYSGIKVSIPPDATDEFKRLLCVFCVEVDTIVHELASHKLNPTAH